jgi:citrate synthase
MPDPARQIIAEVFGVSPDSVGEDLEFHSIPEWDSINHVKLMLALEQRLGVEIGADQLIELASVSKIRQFLSEHGQS